MHTMIQFLKKKEKKSEKGMTATSASILKQDPNTEKVMMMMK